MLKAAEVRNLSKEDRKSKLAEIELELMKERGVQAMGGSTPSPGKIRTLRRERARILTIIREGQLGIRAESTK
ncbi:MAG: 50S ribosomal protein L29 [Candidatus Thermoplasmatota archaeon]